MSARRELVTSVATRHAAAGSRDPPGLEPRVALATAVAVTVLATPLWSAPWNLYDGGIAAASASFTLHGLLPYRDYWHLYGPLSGWLLAIPTAFLGPSVELTRAAGLLLLAAQAAIVYGLCRRWTSAFPASLLAVSSSLIVAAFMGLEMSAWTLSMTLCLLAFWYRLDARRPMLVGVLIGLAILSRQDLGAFALLASLVLPERRRMIIGFASIVVPVGSVILLMSPISFLIEQVVWYPLIGRGRFRAVPGLDVLMPMALAVPLTVTLAVIPRLAIVLAFARALADRRRDLLAMTLFAVLCQLQSVGRVDGAHLAVSTTPAIMLIAASLPRRRGPSVAAIAVVAPALFAAAALGMMIASASGSTSRDLALQRSIAVARQATGRDDAVLVGLVSNRYTILNAPLAYYLLDRPPAMRWTIYSPGVTNTDATQALMVADLEATRTNVLILDVNAASEFEYTNDSRIPGSTIFDLHVMDRFRTWCDFGEFRVAVRVAWNPDGPCPIGSPA